MDWNQCPQFATFEHNTQVHRATRVSRLSFNLDCKPLKAVASRKSYCRWHQSACRNAGNTEGVEKVLASVIETKRSNSYGQEAQAKFCDRFVRQRLVIFKRDLVYVDKPLAINTTEPRTSNKTQRKFYGPKKKVPIRPQTYVTIHCQWTITVYRMWYSLMECLSQRQAKSISLNTLTSPAQPVRGRKPVDDRPCPALPTSYWGNML